METDKVVEYLKRGGLRRIVLRDVENNKNSVEVLTGLRRWINEGLLSGFGVYKEEGFILWVREDIGLFEFDFKFKDAFLILEYENLKKLKRLTENDYVFIEEGQIIEVMLNILNIKGVNLRRDLVLKNREEVVDLLWQASFFKNAEGYIKDILKDDISLIDILKVMDQRIEFSRRVYELLKVKGPGYFRVSMSKILDTVLDYHKNMEGINQFYLSLLRRLESVLTVEHLRILLVDLNMYDSNLVRQKDFSSCQILDWIFNINMLRRS